MDRKLMSVRIRNVYGRLTKQICSDVMILTRPLSYLADLNPEEGVLKDIGNIKDKILIYPGGVGSTVGSYIIYGLKINNKRPIALLVKYIDVVTLVGSILADIPLFIVEDWESIMSLVGNSLVWMGRGCINNEVIQIER